MLLRACRLQSVSVPGRVKRKIQMLRGHQSRRGDCRVLRRRQGIRAKGVPGAELQADCASNSKTQTSFGIS